MTTPSAADIAAQSKLDFAEIGYAVADATPAGLQTLVGQAESEFFRITGQPLVSVDPNLEPLVFEVIRGLAEQQALRNTPENLDTMSDFDTIASFTAGPYTETRRSPEDMYKGRMLAEWPWLSSALWSLLTDDRYDFYISFFSGQNVPAFATTEVWWEGGGALYSGQVWGA